MVAPAHRRRVRRQGLHLAARDPRGRRGPGGRPPGQAAPAARGPIQQCRTTSRGWSRRSGSAPTADGVLLGLEHDGRQQHGPGRHPRRAGAPRPASRCTPRRPCGPAAGRAGQPERAHADAGAGRGTRVVGPGERHERAGRRGRARSARRPAGQLRRGLARDGRPWSSNGLREAYQEGARRYGWRTRHQRPRRDGPWVIGHGMATCSMGSFRFPGAGRSGCAATAPWSRPTCTTSGPACRPC